MKFCEIENLEEQQPTNSKELTQKEISQMSIGQQLKIISQMKEIEYQNSLVMMSLEKYNKKYEQLKKEQTELLENANKKINRLQQSNQILKENIEVLMESLNQKLESEFSSLNDKTHSVVTDTSKNIHILLSSKLDDLSLKSVEYISEVENLKKDAKKRFERFYGRKKWIDYLVLANLIITPFLFLFIAYLTVFKK